MTSNAHDVRAKDREREEIARQIAEYEARNGRIQKLTPNTAPQSDDDDE